MSGAADINSKLILVVHGVGDPAPGSTVAAVARALAEPERPLVHQQESLWLQETSLDAKYVSSFPVYRCRLETKTQRLELAEVYWGDLSRVCQGWLGTIIGLFQILFGLRYVAYVAADQHGRFSLAQKKLGLAIERILQGPVLAITALMAVLSVMLCGAEQIWPGSFARTSWSHTLVLFSCGFACTTSAIGWCLTRSRVFERFWFWLTVAAAFLGAVCLLRVFYLDAARGVERIESQFSGVFWYCRLLVCLLGSLWTVEIVLLMLLALATVGAAMQPRNYRRTIQISGLLPALSIGLWSFGLVLFWLLAVDRIEKHLGLSGFKEVFKDGIPLLGVQFLMTGVIGAAVLFSAGKYLIWRNCNTVRDYERGSRAPRLIVSGSVLLALALTAAIGSSLVMVTQVNQWMGHEYHDYWYGKFLAECNKWAVSLLLPTGLLTVLVLPKLRPVFGIVLEIVNHFVFVSKDHANGLEFDDQFNVRRTTFEHGTMIFARREVVLQRLKRILMHYTESMQGQARPVELVVLSHSQGTMVAIEVLNSPDMDCVNQFAKVTLVTMGSPFSNLYQFFFPNFYPPLKSRFWRRLKQRVHHWTNVFRIDDPVGTEIRFPSLEETQTDDSNPNSHHRTIFSNLPLGCRGHMNYWSDREVLGILRSEVLKTDWEANGIPLDNAASTVSASANWQRRSA